MTKWFDTNYHYLVPELGPEVEFRLAARPKPLAELAEARELGIATRPVLLGPVTFLLLGKPSATTAGSTSSACSTRCSRCTPSCWTSWRPPGPSGSSWTSRPSSRTAPAELDALARAYDRLGGSGTRPKLLVSSYFDHLGDALGVLAGAPVDGGLDLTRDGARNLELLASTGGSATGPWSPGSSTAATCGRTASSGRCPPWPPCSAWPATWSCRAPAPSSTSRSTWTPSSPSTPRSGRGWPSPARRWPR